MYACGEPNGRFESYWGIRQRGTNKILATTRNNCAIFGPNFQQLEKS